MKPAQLRAALNKPARPAPDKGVRLYLAHGPDEAAAYALAVQLGRSVGKDAGRVDLDGGTLRADPARLADEAASISLFGEPRWIRVTGVGEESLPAVEALLGAERAGNPAFALAPGLRNTSKLVKLVADSALAVAVQCYVPVGRAAEDLVRDIAAEHGLRPVRGAGRRLAEGAGGDAAVIAREVEKLALFLDAAPDRPRELDEAALAAVGAEVDDTAADPMIAALLAGRADVFGGELVRLGEVGVSPIQWLRQLARELTLLIDLRIEADRGGDVEGLADRRVHFTRKDATVAAARRWSAPRLARALELVAAAERGEKSAGGAGRMQAESTALTLARAAGDRR